MNKKTTRMAALAAAIGAPFLLAACGSDSVSSEGQSDSTEQAASSDSDADENASANPFNGLYVNKSGDRGVLVDGKTIKIWNNVTGETDFRDEEPFHVMAGSHLETDQFTNGKTKAIRLYDDFDKEIAEIERRDEEYFHLSGEKRVGLILPTTIKSLREKYEAEQAALKKELADRFNPYDGWYAWKGVNGEELEHKYGGAIARVSYGTLAIWWDGNVSDEDLTRDSVEFYAFGAEYPIVMRDDAGEIQAVALGESVVRDYLRPLGDGRIVWMTSGLNGSYDKVMEPLSEEESERLSQMVSQSDMDPVRRAPIPEMHRDKYYSE